MPLCLVSTSCHRLTAVTLSAKRQRCVTNPSCLNRGDADDGATLIIGVPCSSRVDLPFVRQQTPQTIDAILLNVESHRPGTSFPPRARCHRWDERQFESLYTRESVINYTRCNDVVTFGCSFSPLCRSDAFFLRKFFLYNYTGIYIIVFDIF